MFTDFFIKRPVFATVCSILIIVFGIVGYFRLAVQEYPSLDPVVVTVRTDYPGASAQVVETEVTEIIEKELNGVPGMKTLTSESREGSSSIVVEFKLDENLEVGAQEVRTRVARITGNLPDDAEVPVVEKRSGDDERILWIAFSSPNMPILELSSYADRYIKNELETVPGVNSVFIAGERRYAMKIWLDPMKMAARQITVSDVENALRRQNVEIPAGRIEGQTIEYPVRALGRLQTVSEYEDLIIKRNADGSQLKLRDIGRAEIGPANDRIITRFKGETGLSLGISKLSGSNLLEVSQGVKDKLKEISPNFPEGLKYQFAVDLSEFVQIAIDEVWLSLFIAIALVVLIIFFFLRDWRATLIPTVTIPISLIGAFSVMYFLGFSINTLTLFALTLSTGLVVDDTIVVLENIVRYIEEKHLSPFAAAFTAVQEVVVAVIATTVVLVAVFMPVAFAGGTTGRVFNEFAITIAAAVIFSSVVALTLAPAMSARLLKPATYHQDSKFKKFLNIPLQIFENIINLSSTLYAKSLKILMRSKPIVLMVFVACLVLTWWFFSQLPQSFLPIEDRGRIFIPIRGPEGTALPRTDQTIRQVEKELSQIPEVEGYFAVAGFGRSGSDVSSGFSFVKLKPWSERTRPDQSQMSIVQQLFGRFSGITDALVFPINPGSLPGVGQSQPIQFVLQGNDLEELATVSEEFVNRARQLPEIVNIDTNLKLTKPQLNVEVNRAQAGNLGVSVQDIARTLQIMLGGQNITTFNRGNQQYDVAVRGEKADRSSPQDISELYVRSNTGEMVSLSNLVTVKSSTTPPQINHFQRFRSATIEGSPAPNVSLGQALDALENLAKEVLPADMRFSLAGESREFRATGKATVYIFGLALVFIFLTLAAQFESYVDPLIILIAVPLSLLGAFGALWIAQLELNVYGQIGIIMLIGLATKNSILIVEFANQLREQGLSLVAATLQACHLRFRPILMTAFSTIVGVLPLAIATGAGAASRQAIGTTVLGGMLVSTILTLFVVPVFYVIANNLQNRIFPPKVHNWEEYFSEADQLLGEENHAVHDHHTPHINGNGHSNGNGNGNSHNDHMPTNQTKSESEEKPFTDIYK